MSDGQVSRPTPTVSAFLREVVAAGGSAHVVTFARLGAINAPAVRDHFPRLLESGVPEAVLLHILAPVPPAGHDEPAQPPTRADVPAPRTMPRAPLMAAVEARPWPHLGEKPP